MGTKQNTKYKMKFINQSTKSFKQEAQYKHRSEERRVGKECVP